MAITSTNGHVDVESVRFTGAAIGISGDTSDNDETAALAGIAAAGLNSSLSLCFLQNRFLARVSLQRLRRPKTYLAPSSRLVPR